MTTDFENENNNEFTEPEAALQEDGPQKTGAAANLVEAWQTRPLFKFMVLVIGVFAVGAAAVKFFSDDGPQNEFARISKPPILKEAPGGVVSPYMRKQTEMATNERVQQAIATGGSAIQTPLGQMADASDNIAGKEVDPLKELRAETELLKKQVRETQQVQKQIQIQREPFDNSLADAMQRQMQLLVTSWTPQQIKLMNITKNEDKKEERAGAGSSGRAARTIIPAGTVSYAQLLTEANSDVPGPILAQIVSGPLSGARVIGSFQSQMGYEKYLVMSFSLATKRGKEYTINAVALDPDTTLGGMATEVDERYFSRVVLPAAAGFLEGVGSAISSGGTSVTTNGSTTIVSQTRQGMREGMYNGLSEAAQTMGQFFQNQANLTQPLVRVAAGTPFGIFFVAAVKEQTSDGSLQVNQGAQGVAANASNLPQGYGVSYPGVNAVAVANPLPYPNYVSPSRGSSGSSSQLQVYTPNNQPYVPPSQQTYYGYGR